MKLALPLIALTLSPIVLAGQQTAPDHATMDHSAMNHEAPTAAPAVPTLPGQDAYGAIGEIVRMLEADPKTDWSRVDIEKLRQHLIDMNVVTLQSRVSQHAVPDGIDMTITGDGRTEAAIRRMVTSHGAQLGALGLTSKAEPVSGGMHFVVTATDTTDTKLVAKIRGLGFLGVMTLGAHHAVHHLALASGSPMAGH